MKLNIEPIQATLALMNEEIDTLRKRYQAEAQGLLNVAVANFFEATPEIEYVTWTQYTPYWNDGEECTFSVNDIYYGLNRSLAEVQPARSDWDAEDDDDEEHEYDDEGDQFTDVDVSKIRTQIGVINDAIATGVVSSEMYTHPYSYYCFSSADNSWNGRRGGDNDVFDREKSKSRVAELESRLRDAELERKMFPNRGQIIDNFNSFKKLIRQIDDGTMQELFGDHVKVLLTKDGIETQEYDHE